MKIGFIGVGVMGGPMGLNLMKKGFDVSIYTRTKSKAEGVIAAGAHWCDTIADCAAGRDVVITIVGYPKDVEEVYFSEKGILNSADKGTVLIDMTTTSPRRPDSECWCPWPQKYRASCRRHPCRRRP